MSCICLCAPDQIRTGMDYSVREIGLETGFEPVKVPIFSKQDFLRQFTLLIKSLVSTIPPLGQYFNELIFVVLGGLEPCNHLQTFTVSVLPVKLQDFLLFGGYCKSSLLNHSGLPWTAIVDFKTQAISHYSTKSLQDLSYPGYVLDNDDSFRVVSCLYKLFGS